MKATSTNFDFNSSLERIENILKEPNDYKQLDYFPNESRLTFDNGFYVNATAIFIDLRDSSSLNSENTKRQLARIYKAFISEATAIINSYSGCEYIYIEGDCVWGMIDTPDSQHFNEVYSLIACRLSALIDVLNVKIRKKYLDPNTSINAGIGIAFGKTLMIKTGINGGGVNEITWIGEMVGRAAKLSGIGGKNSRSRIIVDENFYNKLNAENQKKFKISYSSKLNKYIYESNYVDSKMYGWAKQNA